MKCPVCNVNHQKRRKAEICTTLAKNEMTHYIVITSGMPGGMTEENLLKFPHIKKNGLDHFRKTKQLSKDIEEYINQF